MNFKLPFGNSVLILSHENLDKFVAVPRKEAPEKLCFPGGKQEAGESSIEGAIRETYEETGIKFKESDLIPIYTGMCKSDSSCYWVTNYVAFISENVKFSSPEGMQPIWVNQEIFLARSAFLNYNQKVFASLKDIV